MKLSRLLLFLPVLVVALSASSCQTTATAVNPFAQCKTPGQCYLAITGTVKASADALVEVKANPDTPPSVKDAIKKAGAAAAPVMDKGSQVYALYRHVKADLNTCAADDGPCKADANQKIANATANMAKWVTEATPLANDLLALAAGDAP